MTKITEALHKNLTDPELSVDDYMGDDQHLSITVRSSDFLGHSSLMCHRMVQQIIKKELGNDFIGGVVHALKIEVEAKE
ncbi:BolA/IbaG family iron-sulfur metabolism protein [Candidatus Xenohaliotis californiensis]|uniref:BolA/IbaG family iron-sulfur metabolism protein n=1 Tax=Candidatus Xenohaliotis californiensis TaxID=84677 RepID=UPI0030C7FD6A